MYDIPVALHVDHCPSFNTIVQCIRNNYTSVMIDGAHLDYKENVELVKRVTEMAHAVGMQVEGEIGKIGGVEDDMFVNEDEAALTVPSEAKQFVEDTGIDTLAIAIGTAHGMYKGEPKLDFERLSQIEAIVDVPLVLHGASGVPDASIKEAIKKRYCESKYSYRVKKILWQKQLFTHLKKNKDENDPRNYMGAARDAVKEVVKQKNQTVWFKWIS